LKIYKQEYLIWNTNWKYLFVLDACRYDYFKELYINYFKGKLLKVYSPACRTVEWLDTIFKRPLNCYYFSCCPWIHSHSRWSLYNRKIIDLWDGIWESKLKTVPAKEANKAILIKYLEYIKRKSIIHYVQPHYPYIGKYKFPIPPSGKIDNMNQIIMMLQGREEELKKAYISNLEYVLEATKELIDYLDGDNIIITSDHGELLGEHNYYFHDYSPVVIWKELREIPWLILKK